MCINIFMVLLLVSLSCSQGKTIEFFVSPMGNDSNPGTASAPFKSLGKAKESVRACLIETPGKPIVVNIKGGIYQIENPIRFSSEDSGSKNASVTYKAMKGEIPVFTGSREVKKWNLVTEIDKLTLLSLKSHKRVYVADTKSAGVSDTGDPTEIGKRPELICNGELQILARWPNEDFLKAGIAKGKTKTPLSYVKEHGTKEGIFEYLEDRQVQWSAESDVRLEGYWYWDWCDEYHKVNKIDTLTKTFYLNEPYHHYGYRDSLRYFGLNLLCEIDQPKEWYLDRANGLIYWFPLENIDPNNAIVTLTEFSSQFLIEIDNCSNVVIEGLTLQEGRGSAIFINGGKNCSLKYCRIMRFGKDGICIKDGHNHGVSGCLLQYLGHRGIDIKGGDRKTLTPANHFVENSIVEYFSHFKRTYEPAVHLDGCGIKVINNRFSYSSSSAMRLEGNDFTIEYNEISQVVNESDDQGGIEIFYNPSYRGIIIRYNRWSDIKGGTRHGAAGVRLDDMISGVTIFGNVFERCGTLNFGGVQIHGGKDNLVENNLFFNCSAAVSFSKWEEERWLNELDNPVMKKKLYEEVDIRSALYQSRYPELKNIRSRINVNRIKNNLLVDCDRLFIGTDEDELQKNNSSVRADGNQIEMFCSSMILNKYGMKPKPVQNMGPKMNKWLKAP